MTLTEAARLRAALAFYADPENWRTRVHARADGTKEEYPLVHGDYGRIARAALGMPEPPDEG